MGRTTRLSTSAGGRAGVVSKPVPRPLPGSPRDDVTARSNVRSATTASRPPASTARAREPSSSLMSTTAFSTIVPAGSATLTDCPATAIVSVSATDSPAGEIGRLPVTCANVPLTCTSPDAAPARTRRPPRIGNSVLSGALAARRAGRRLTFRKCTSSCATAGPGSETSTKSKPLRFLASSAAARASRASVSVTAMPSVLGALEAQDAGVGAAGGAVPQVDGDRRFLRLHDEVLEVDAVAEEARKRLGDRRLRDSGGDLVEVLEHEPADIRPERRLKQPLADRGEDELQHLLGDVLVAARDARGTAVLADPERERGIRGVRPHCALAFWSAMTMVAGPCGAPSGL